MDTASVSLILSKLEEVVKAAGGKVEAFYPYLVKQALLVGYLCAVGIGIAIVSLIVGIYFAVKSYDKMKDYVVPGYVAVAMVCGFIFLISIIASTSGPISFLAIFNPEYYATKLLFNIFK